VGFFHLDLFTSGRTQLPGEQAIVRVGAEPSNQDMKQGFPTGQISRPD
jgi:hypothetical protein